MSNLLKNSILLLNVLFCLLFPIHSMAATYTNATGLTVTSTTIAPTSNQVTVGGVAYTSEGILYNGTNSPYSATTASMLRYIIPVLAINAGIHGGCFGEDIGIYSSNQNGNLNPYSYYGGFSPARSATGAVVNPQFVIPYTGYYKFGVNMTYCNYDSYNFVITTQLLKNYLTGSSTLITSHDDAFGCPNLPTSCSMNVNFYSTATQFSSGDTVGFYIYSSNGGSRNTTFSSGSLSVIFCGPSSC